MKKKFTYISVAAAATLAMGIFYVGVHQAFRQGANEPQKSMANDVAASLENGARPGDLTRGQVNVATNMAPFVIIYDKTGKVVAGNGYLDGQVPQVPIGVLRAASREKPNQITWQPEGKVRVASVAYATRDYYVLGGRSLKVVEKQIGRFTRWLVCMWAAVVLLLALTYAMVMRREKRASSKEV